MKGQLELSAQQEHSLKERAMILHIFRYTPKQIAKSLGLPIKLVKRWLTEFPKQR